MTSSARPPAYAFGIVIYTGAMFTFAYPALFNFFMGKENYFTQQARANEQLEMGLAIKQMGDRIEMGQSPIPFPPVIKIDRDGRDRISESFQICAKNVACYTSEGNKLIESAARIHQSLTPNYLSLAITLGGGPAALLVAWGLKAASIRRETAAKAALIAQNAPKA